MCESNVFVQREEGEVLVAEDVARVVPDKDEIRVMTLLGDETKIRGDIVEIDLMTHRILIKEK